ncbi:unnamed protein product [Cladocopium goreaui]|uniref:Peridinin-chlorophyll a-binding protein, chloroplastic (PCP) n=1 Tax=Cladocopium goreaui TaxID=2562237 RepID=A0A9P1BQJ6_9DINO|nr:unnamed protein product [Cladocopium goreaui]
MASMREAAQLYGQAESAIRDEQFQDCIAAAEKAVQIFHGMGAEGASGLIDALYILVDAHRQMATTMQEKPQNALSISGQYLEKFRVSKNRRGEAAMLLSLAEINHDKRGRKKRQEALETAAEALRIFVEINDRKFEVLTLIVTGMAHYKFFMYDAMLEEAQRSLDIAEQLGDKFLTAKAQNLTGLAFSSQRKIDEAMERGRAALALWRELGMKRQEAIQTHAMAGWLLYSRWPKKALALAEQAPKGATQGQSWKASETVRLYKCKRLCSDSARPCKPFVKSAQLAFLRAQSTAERKAIAVGVAVAAACCLQRHLNFVPGPRHAAPVAAAAASMMMAPAAFADEIGDAAKKLGDASYSFAKEVDWNNGIFLQAPGKFQPLEALKAIDKMIEMGAAADPKLLKEAAEAHHKAIGSISGPNGVTSRADWDAVNAALGRVIASVPKAKVMAVYDSVKAITDPGVPAYMKSLVNGPDAEKAYQGFLEFKDVVEKNQVATASAPAVVPSGDKIGEAAKALSDASYPFIKDIDWLSDVYLKPLPGKTAPETLQAIDKMIVMGAKMDGNLLKAAAEAHHKAIGSIDATGVTSAADYEAVNAAIGRLVASVPKTTVMDVYNSMAKVVDSSVPNNMFSKVNPLDAVAAAKGFYTFKDVVEASQR